MTVSELPHLVEDLYRSEQPRLVRLAFLLLGNPAAAEDVVNDAFLRVLPRLSEVETPSAYLTTVVVNLCRDVQRRRQTEDRYSETLAVRPTFVATDEPTVLDELDVLPPRQRHALVLRYYLDLPVDEVARMLGCRPSAARSLVHRGLRTIRKGVTK